MEEATLALQAACSDLRASVSEQGQQEERLFAEAHLTAWMRALGRAPVSAFGMRIMRHCLSEALDVVRPPKLAPMFLIELRRAPTQEEYFRGSLPQNPISNLDVLSEGLEGDPTMRDLRARIAADLDFRDATELIELLVQGHIVSLDLPVRLVYSQFWLPRAMEGRSAASESEADEDEAAESEHGMEGPPMVVTYRLAGLDGEATEPMLDALVDPEAEGDADPEAVYGVTRALARPVDGTPGCRNALQLLVRVVREAATHHHHASAAVVSMAVELLQAACELPVRARARGTCCAAARVLTDALLGRTTASHCGAKAPHLTCCRRWCRRSAAAKI